MKSQLAPAMLDVKVTVNDSVEESGKIPLQPMTKASVIDQELNQRGMGRYQWYIWAVCSTGYFLDVMWIQAFALAAPNIQRELGFSDKEYGNIASSFTAGITAGGFVWGALIDVVGRRVAFLGTSLIAGIFGMCLGGLSSYNGLLAIIAFTGFGIGGNIPVNATITVEYLPADRFYLLTALSIFLPIGFVVSTLIGFGLIPNYSCSTDLLSCRLTEGVTPCCSKEANMGWRYLFFTAAAITLGFFIFRFFIFPFYESPRFLLAKGNDHGAVEVVNKIAAFNKQSCDLTIETLYKRSNETPIVEENGFYKRLVSELSRMKLLFGNRKVLRVAMHVWITWMFDCFGYYTAVAYLPTILQRKNSAINVGLKQTYIDYLIVYAPGIIAVILAILMVRAPMIGRKWTLVFSSMVMGISLFLFSIVNTQTSYVGINMLEFFCQCLFNSTLFGWTPEAFPTAVRGTATGLAGFFGNLLGISGPLIAGQLFGGTGGENAVLYLAGSSLFICTISILCLPAKDMVAPR